MESNARPLNFHLWRLLHIKFSRVEHYLSHKIGEEVPISRNTFSARPDFTLLFEHDLITHSLHLQILTLFLQSTTE